MNIEQTDQELKEGVPQPLRFREAVDRTEPQTEGELLVGGAQRLGGVEVPLRAHLKFLEQFRRHI